MFLSYALIKLIQKNLFKVNLHVMQSYNQVYIYIADIIKHSFYENHW